VTDARSARHIAAEVTARPSRNRMTARVNDERRNFGACTTSVSIKH
jgi:hypothetical protein